MYKFLSGVTMVLMLTAVSKAPGQEPMPPRRFDVRSLGATGNGTVKDTAAFQKAFDACAAGGGEVVVPAGNYLIGSVVIGSHTTLRLEKGAALAGSPDADDYPLLQARWEGRLRECHRALLCASNATQIAIVGPGSIEGNAALGNLRNPRGPCL